ncbi:MAG: aminoglycoside phosphotransferase family protein [Candidatus Hecatellales archaeon]|nr:MAG: aminoglycoside phosphotransferase family protein [Candidatus Hecatellales archaeon]
MRGLKETLKAYLSSLHGMDVEILSVGGFEKPEEAGRLDLKGFGYGKPILAEYEAGGKRFSVVVQTMKPDSFGHEHPGDRAQSLILAYQTYGRLPRHVKALDLGVFTEKGEMVSLRGFEEFFLLVEKAEGREYFWDLNRIAERGSLTSLDLERCRALANYLAEIHRVKKEAPNLYRRRIRELLGHGECIMGIIDNYPENADFIRPGEFEEFEKLCVGWRWRLRGLEYRLSQVHGDFHPWNILFREGLDFTVLDRSRGEWGEPADDFSCMSVNYIFYSLQMLGRWGEPFKTLFEAFVDTYLKATGDEEILRVCQPFYAWRCLVLASPIWYPTLPGRVRRTLLDFAFNLLESSLFEWRKVDQYLKPRG